MFPALPLLVRSKPDSNSSPFPALQFRPQLTLRGGALILEGQETVNPSVNASLIFGKEKPASAYFAFGATLGCEGYFGDSRTAGGGRIGPKAIYRFPLAEGIFAFFGAELSFTAGGGKLALPNPGSYRYSGADLVLVGGLNFLSLYLKAGFDAEYRKLPSSPPQNPVIVHKIGAGIDLSFF